MMRAVSFLCFLLIMPGLESTASAAPSAQFDLKCAGGLSENNAAKKDFQQVIHVDLSSNMYCLDDCKSVQHIHDVTPTSIDLIFYKVEKPYYDVFEVFEIDRSTGGYSHLKIQTKPSVESSNADGTCAAAKFTPFPVQKF